MAFDRFKLEKLKILAFKDVERSGTPLLEFEAMFNPTSYSESYAIQWARQQGINSTGAELRYTCSPPGELSLDLVLDGTGVDEIGLLAPTRKTVRERIDQLLKVTRQYNGEIHQTNYLIVQWGKLDFSCCLSSLTINYTRFDREGNPLRAELKVSFVSDASAQTLVKQKQPSSPDLTHARIVKSGDTLPLLTKAIYGSSARYLDVARYNDLDDFRVLTPGREIVFPPLAVLDAEQARGS
jgi:contractile injection system tube protein